MNLCDALHHHLHSFLHGSRVLVGDFALWCLAPGTTSEMDGTLRQILGLLRAAGGDLRTAETEGGDFEEDDGEDETEKNRHDRSLRSSMDEVSDDELWRYLHYGRPGDDESPRNHGTYRDVQVQSMMRDTNDVV